MGIEAAIFRDKTVCLDNNPSNMNRRETYAGMNSKSLARNHK